MSILDNSEHTTTLLQQQLTDQYQIFLESVQDEEPVLDESIQFNDNVIGNNSAILLTDNAQSTVNFLYVNPIEFFNNGRAGDIHLDITLAGETATGVEREAVRPHENEDVGGRIDRKADSDDSPERHAASDTPTAVSAPSHAVGDLGILDDLSVPEPFDLLGSLGLDEDQIYQENAASDIMAALSEDLGNVDQFNDNVIGNNAAILMTDNAQSTVNFLYINPIEFFNDGRASDIYINITEVSQTTTETSNRGSVSLEAESTESINTSPGNTSSPTQFNGNVIGNNSAILLTDDAESTVNFLYINPIEFFNDGRASDIYINYSKSGDSFGEAKSEEVSGSADQRAGVGDDASADLEPVSALLGESSLIEDLLENLDVPAPVSLLDGFGISEESLFQDQAAGDILEVLSEDLDDADQFNDNVIGNNSAILLTDDAQSTVNFLYVNPIEFFNDGRASDIHLDLDLSSGSSAEAAGEREGRTESLAEATPEDLGGVDSATQTQRPAPTSQNADELGSLGDKTILDDGSSPETLDLSNVLENAGEIFPEGEGLTENDEESKDDAAVGKQINDNLIGNNNAILLTDESESSVNFTYINPIEFFNEGRASDIYLNAAPSEESSTEVLSKDVGPRESGDESRSLEDLAGDASKPHCEEQRQGHSEEAESALLESRHLEDAAGSADALDILDDLSVLETLIAPEPLSLLDGFGISEESLFQDNGASDVLDVITEDFGDADQFNNNVIGNNAAILLTDNAQSTVNFLYVNPIQFFNGGRGGDIHIDITVNEEDGFFFL